MGEAKAAMQDVQDMNNSSDDEITLDERVQMLNMDQKRIYEKVKMHLDIQMKSAKTKRADAGDSGAYADFLKGGLLL